MKHFIFFFLVLFAGEIQAVDNPDAVASIQNFEKDYKQKWEQFKNAKTTRDMEGTLKELLLWSEKQMAQLLQEAQKNEDKELAKKMSEAQKAWQDYYQKEVDLTLAKAKKNPSSSQGVTLYQIKIELIKERILTLHHFLSQS